MPSEKNNCPTEHEEQVDLVKWFREAFPAVLIFAIPNGEKRDISVAKRLKAEGVTKGIPDLFIPDWRLWVEMKRQKVGSLSKEQKDIIAYLESVGYESIVAKGAADAVKQILDFCVKNKIIEE